MHRKSVSGMVLFLASAPITFKSRLQPTIDLSSTESEFIAVSDAGKMTLYLRGILDSISMPQQNVTPLYEGNAAAIAIENSCKPTRQTRHIELNQV